MATWAVPFKYTNGSRSSHHDGHSSIWGLFLGSRCLRGRDDAAAWRLWRQFAHRAADFPRKIRGGRPKSGKDPRRVTGTLNSAAANSPVVTQNFHCRFCRNSAILTLDVGYYNRDVIDVKTTLFPTTESLPIPNKDKLSRFPPRDPNVTSSYSLSKGREHPNCIANRRWNCKNASFDCGPSESPLLFDFLKGEWTYIMTWYFNRKSIL